MVDNVYRSHRIPLLQEKIERLDLLSRSLSMSVVVGWICLLASKAC
jgi:hypothetical protein